MRAMNGGMETAGAPAKRPRESVNSGEAADTLAAHERARAVFANPQYAVSEREFVKTYGREEVEKDEKLAKGRRAEYGREETAQQAEAKRLAEIFEAILLTEGQESGWLGDDVKILKTADYDDIVNHTDLIAEWREKGARPHMLGLAVDVTFGPSTLERKFALLQDKIDKGQLGRLKYAHTEQSNVPRVVIGMSRETVKELMAAWVKEDYAALEGHPIQRVVLEQILAQLTTIARYARDRGNTRVADAYERSIEPIRSVLRTKTGISLDAVAGDKVSAGINEQIEKRFAPRVH
jgi:hypothetical protein